MCGVIGGYCRGVPIVLDSILSSEFVYHRGHDSSGIATIDGSKIRKVADVGFFGDWPEEKRGELNKLSGNDIVNLHIRYSTIGNKKKLLKNAQPFVINPSDVDGKEHLSLAISHNGHVFSTQVKKRPEYDNDIKQIAFPIYNKLSKGSEEELVKGVKKMMMQAKGGYSLVGFIYNGDRKRLFFCRDPLGIRPLYWAELDGGGIVAASEDIVLSNLEVGENERKRCKKISKVPAGSLFVYDGNKLNHYEIETGPDFECGFEYVYFSSYGRKGITKVRKALGRQLWKESPVEADIVVPIPDSGKIHGEGFADASEIPLVEGGLARNRYKGQRSFIMPSDELRKNTIKRKITATREIEGRRVVLVDDSIVRGNTINLVVEDVKTVDPEEIHLRIGSPPVCFPCFLGIDMQEIDKFWYVKVAEEIGCEKFDANIYKDSKIKDDIIEKMRYKLNVDSIAYLSYFGLRKVIGINHCFGCWNPDGYHKKLVEDMMSLAKNLK
jgi:amidophosphoribosyltransferase